MLPLSAVLASAPSHHQPPIAPAALSSPVDAAMALIEGLRSDARLALDHRNYVLLKRLAEQLNDLDSQKLKVEVEATASGASANASAAKAKQPTKAVTALMTGKKPHHLMCRECNVKAPSWGYVDPMRAHESVKGRMMWCSGCAKAKYPGSQRLMNDQKCEDCNKMYPCWGPPKVPGDDVGPRASRRRWCSSCAVQFHPGAVDHKNGVRRKKVAREVAQKIVTGQGPRPSAYALFKRSVYPSDAQHPADVCLTSEGRCRQGEIRKRWDALTKEEKRPFELSARAYQPPSKRDKVPLTHEEKLNQLREKRRLEQLQLIEDWEKADKKTRGKRPAPFAPRNRGPNKKTKLKAATLQAELSGESLAVAAEVAADSDAPAAHAPEDGPTADGTTAAASDEAQASQSSAAPVIDASTKPPAKEGFLVKWATPAECGATYQQQGRGAWYYWNIETGSPTWA